jgi:uncharacterized protein YjbJ (UPF0337 family)
MSPANHEEGRHAMPDNMDDAKGRLKRAAGELTDDDDLKREGSVDKGAGKAKEAVDTVADKTKDVLDDDT